MRELKPNIDNNIKDTIYLGVTNYIKTNGLGFPGLGKYERRQRDIDPKLNASLIDDHPYFVKHSPIFYPALFEETSFPEYEFYSDWDILGDIVKEDLTDVDELRTALAMEVSLLDESVKSLWIELFRHYYPENDYIALLKEDDSFAASMRSLLVLLIYLSKVLNQEVDKSEEYSQIAVSILDFAPKSKRAFLGKLQKLESWGLDELVEEKNPEQPMAKAAKILINILSYNEIPSDDELTETGDLVRSLQTLIRALERYDGDNSEIEVLINVNNSMDDANLTENGTVGNHRTIQLFELIKSEVPLEIVLTKLDWLKQAAKPVQRAFEMVISGLRDAINEGLSIHCINCTDGKFPTGDGEFEGVLRSGQGARRKMLEGLNIARVKAAGIDTSQIGVMHMDADELFDIESLNTISNRMRDLDNLNAIRALPNFTLPIRREWQEGQREDAKKEFAMTAAYFYYVEIKNVFLNIYRQVDTNRNNQLMSSAVAFLGNFIAPLNAVMDSEGMNIHYDGGEDARYCSVIRRKVGQAFCERPMTHKTLRVSDTSYLGNKQGWQQRRRQWYLRFNEETERVIIQVLDNIKTYSKEELSPFNGQLGVAQIPRTFPIEILRYLRTLELLPAEKEAIDEAEEQMNANSSGGLDAVIALLILLRKIEVNLDDYPTLKKFFGILGEQLSETKEKMIMIR